MAKRTGSQQNGSSIPASYDLIVVGSGNGACGFLSECLKHNEGDDLKILVLEQGRNYFETSKLTHQDNWSKIYATKDLFQLHNCKTPKGRAIISGRAKTMGGGGSINFSMIHESSKWLADQMGYNVKYWDELKKELNAKFKRPDLFTSTQTAFSSYIQTKANNPEDETVSPYALPKREQLIENIPSLRDDVESYPTKEAKQLYAFPTQFNAFGQRTNSGVSLVDWEKVTLMCRREVTQLVMNGATCAKVKVKNTSSNQHEEYVVRPGGRVILACGSQSPRLLLRTPELTNIKIGKRVNDHICMPLAIYLVPEEQESDIGPKNAYEPTFAVMNVDAGNDARTDGEVVCFDFFTGDVERLAYLVSSLYLCYLPFNTAKRIMGRFPFLFTILSNFVRVLLTVVLSVIRLLHGLGNILKCKPFGANKFIITTSLAKFNSVKEGHYERKNDEIILNFFEEKEDFTVAEEAITKNLSFLESLGSKPNVLLRFLFTSITKIPYEKRQVRRYVENFSKNSLLSEQHLAGGCIFGDVLDKGITDTQMTGKVIGSENIHVADLSAVPLPRVSTQMTAYLVGHHVGKHLFSKAHKKVQ
mmetsp:Transcript_21772/g.32271  ORF Transcript_21772/g.32271 Transcript_21772/m.32271 type:complete len:587 (-) Transcript_21772:125-1885(-)